MPPESFTPDPQESDLLVHVSPRYVESGGAERERWHGTARSCAVCGEELVVALTPAGELLELAVRQRTWRVRLDARKEHYLAERAAGYPEHHCKQEGPHPPENRG